MMIMMMMMMIMIIIIIIIIIVKQLFLKTRNRNIKSTGKQSIPEAVEGYCNDATGVIPVKIGATGTM
jgi:F0F1-type ATP synthase membrane subunit a